MSKGATSCSIKCESTSAPRTTFGLVWRFAIALALATAACRNKTAAGYAEPPPDGVIVVCPVSGVSCEKTPLTRAAVYEMRTYYFCSEDAAARFAEAPERFVGR